MTFREGARLGPYEILSLVGRGGMGEVYRARDTRLNRDVAVKVLPASVGNDQSRRARFAREAMAISQLSHPHICAIYDIGEQDGVAYLVMEYLDGEPLGQRLRRGPVPWATALPWAIQIASAIDAAHRRGIVHRDLKPGNAMITESGVKLLDFGLAKLVEGSLAAISAAGSAATESLTAEQRLVGTMHYMSPEQLEGRDVDARTDVFALGTTLYEMLTGRKAFEGSSAASVTAAILTSDPPSVSSSSSSSAGEPAMPPGLDHVIRRALAKHPDERWQTARDMMLELRWVLEGRPGRGSRAPARSASKRALVLAAGATALLVAGAFVGWSLRSPGQTPPDAATIFTVQAPEGTRLNPGYGLFAVSPDARKIAFLAGPTADDNRIWIRSLDSLVARPLLGTEGAINPFWSPDSEWLGFQAGKQLKRVAISGGTPTVITDLAPRGIQGGNMTAAWATADTIVIAEPSGLQRINLSGGTPLLLATTDESRAERNVVMPSLLPGGRYLSLVVKRVLDDSQTRIGSLDKTLDVRLPAVQSNAAFAAGHLLYRRGDALVAQAFDERALRLEGQPVVLAEGVQYNPGNMRTVFSVAGNVLTYRLELPRKLVWRDRTGRATGTIGEAGRDWNPALAPDGSGRVAIDRLDPSTTRFAIWTIDQYGQSAAVTRSGRERFGVWSPDGEWIAFGSYGVAPELRRTHLRSGKEELLFKGETGAFPLDWSSDGKFFLYGTGVPGDLWALPLTGSNRTPIRLTNTPATEVTAHLSPDSRWLAYGSREDGERRVWVQSFPDGTSKRLISEKGGFDPRWRADGRELFFVTPDGTLMAAPVNPDTMMIGPPSALFKIDTGAAGAPMHVYASSRDGQRFLVSEIGGGPDSFTVVVNWPALVR
jgi:Tol biopolymer transport system component